MSEQLFDRSGTIWRQLDVKRAGRTVPDGAVALARTKKRPEPAILAAGDDLRAVEGPVQLFAEGAFELPLVARVATQDGFACEVEARVALSLDTNEVEALQDFVRSFVESDATEVTPAELAAHLGEEFTLAAKKFAATRTAESLHEHDVSADAAPLVQSALRKPLLIGGLVFNGVQRCLVTVPELEKLRGEEAEARKEEIVARQRQRIRAIWEKDRRREELSRHEFEEFMRGLAHEGVLRELDRKREAMAKQDEIDRAWAAYEHQQHDLKKALDALEVDRELQIDRLRFEERLAQAKRAHDTLKGASLEFFISTLDDEQVKARLYRQLMARDMTPEQIETLASTDRNVGELLEKMLQRIEEALDRGAKSSDFRSFRDDSPRTTVHRALLVVGKRVLAYDPNDYRTVERPNEIHDVSRHPLGSLRSVRVDRVGNEPVLLAGARQGCYVLRPGDGSPAKVSEHAFFTESVHKGGSNSAIVVGNKLIAAHSEQGLAVWPLDNPDHLSTPLYREFTSGNETTRGLQLVRRGDKHLALFSTGGLICGFDPANPGSTPAHCWRGGGREVTGVVVYGDSLWAGNREGKLLRWPLDREEDPEVVLQEPHAIYMLRLALIGGMPQLVFGSKSFGVTARSISNPGLSTRYEADAPIRWVDAASDFVFGISADQRHLYVWKTNDPAHPIRKITPGDRIQDLALWLAE